MLKLKHVLAIYTQNSNAVNYKLKVNWYMYMQTILIDDTRYVNYYIYMKYPPSVFKISIIYAYYFTLLHINVTYTC